MRYPLFGLAQSGKSVTVTGEYRKNVYYERQPYPDRDEYAIYSTAGLDLFGGFGDTNIRGWLDLNELLFVVHRGTLWEVNAAFAKTNRGTLNTTTGKVYISCNGNILFITDGTNGYTYNTSTNAFAVVGGSYVAGQTTTWIAGYYIADRLGSVDKTQYGRYSFSTDGTTWNALDFISAEATYDPLVRVYNDNQELILFGQYTTEFHGITVNPNQPFSRVSVIEWGLAAQASVAKMNDSVIFLAKNRMGKAQVIVLNGYSPQVVSNQEISSLIDGYGDVSNAQGMSFMYTGHPFYVITFPNVSKTWLYDGSTSLWTELTTGLNDSRWLGALAISYLGDTLIADYTNGNVYKLNPNSLLDNGSQVIRMVRSRHVFNEVYQWVKRLIIDMESGVGLATGQGSDPKVMLNVSKDGGRTYPIERTANLGKMGETLKRVRFDRIGRSKDFVFELSTTDPVKTVITGAWIESE